MISKTVLFVFASLLAAQASPIRREVPQEHSHEATLRAVAKLLAVNNPDGILDPVFGLLGNAAAINGAGKIADATCLQQATADQAFTNAKAANDVQGQVDALVFRALERNTGKVGLASDPCTSIKAVNAEIAAISQHQDPASADAATVNKAITLELAKQIASVGGDPLDALKAGTFAPGDVNDATAKGNTCDDANDAAGCIFSQNLIVEDASTAEIAAAVAGVDAGNGENNNAGDGEAAGGDNTGECPTPVTVTVQPSAAATAGATEAASSAEASVTAAPSATASAGAGNNAGAGNAAGGGKKGGHRTRGGRRGRGRNARRA
jgi:hypothetical protein